MQILSGIFSFFSKAQRQVPKSECVNDFSKQLTEKEINSDFHREFVGGMWDELGMLQFDFLKRNGLMPHHYLLDVGCGALRGGVRFIRYLEAEHYCGLDLNASLIAAGKKELKKENLLDKRPNLLVNDKFEFSRLGRTFDYAVAVSVFTHLPMNHIIRCLVEVRKVLNADARLFATFFEAPTTAHIEIVSHTPGMVQTNYDADPFHYSFEEFQWMAQIANMRVELIGEWAHPRDQRMLSFRLPK
jgi:cyclopropane fatty-acyl-phospholipid synthase-like methyltransferase